MLEQTLYFHFSETSSAFIFFSTGVGVSESLRQANSLTRSENYRSEEVLVEPNIKINCALYRMLNVILKRRNGAMNGFLSFRFTLENSLKDSCVNFIRNFEV